MIPTSIITTSLGLSSYPKQMQGYDDHRVGCRAPFLLDSTDEKGPRWLYLLQNQ